MSGLSRRDFLIRLAGGTLVALSAEIVRVEVSFDEGKQWQDAGLSEERSPYAWRLWRYAWKGPKPGRYQILSRATDSRGQIQPMTTPWNPGGYHWNGIDGVRVEVEA